MLLNSSKIQLFFKNIIIISIIILLVITSGCSTIKNLPGIFHTIKAVEINKMINFLNDKYGIDVKASDCIYYREENYTTTESILSPPHTFNIPYLGVFVINGEKITVADRKGFISDNRQLKDLNKIIAQYFTDKTGIQFDFVEIEKAYGGSISGNDNVFNVLLQTKFNKLITKDNVSDFLDLVYQEEWLNITFYVKDTTDRVALIDNLSDKLSYLEKYEEIRELKVIGYNSESELIINKYECDYNYEYKRYNTSDDFNDNYKFGYYYIDRDKSDLLFCAEMDLNRGYTSFGEEVVDRWKLDTDIDRVKSIFH